MYGTLTPQGQPIRLRDMPPGLSASGMKDLAISPLRFWHLHVDPERPKPIRTPAMEFGSALHCAILEPEKFARRYCQKISPGDFEVCLVTVEDIRKWVTDNGGTPKGASKSKLIDQAQAIDPAVPIFDVLKYEHDDKNSSKVQFGRDDWERLHGAIDVLKSEPKLAEILSHEDGETERAYFVEHDGINLKARMDFVSPDVTLDIKTFTARPGETIDKAVTNAIWFRRYYIQAFTYSLVRSIADGFDSAEAAPPFVFAFVESDPPYETRLRVMRPTLAGQPNLLWERARMEVAAMVQLYRDLKEQFGEEPWRYACRQDDLVDEEFRQLAFG